MQAIGLTGGIGSGKTTVERLFSALGVPIIDADVIAAQLTAVGQPAYQPIIDHFGSAIIMADKSLDRKQLRDIIFHDAKQREWLERLLHPMIFASIKSMISVLEADYCIVVMPLLVEAGAEHLVDRVVVVDMPEALQIERTCQRDGVSREKAEKIMQTQTSRAQRLAVADEIIDNQGSLADLSKNVQILHEKYLKMSHGI